MYIEFASRMIGMVIFALVGARLGVSAAPVLDMPQLGVSFIFSLVGVLFGLIMTPWITVRPLRALDEVAYLRFASVYRAFESAEDFETEIAVLRMERAAPQPQPTG